LVLLVTKAVDFPCKNPWQGKFSTQTMGITKNVEEAEQINRLCKVMAIAG